MDNHAGELTIKTPIDEMMGKLPGVTRVTIPCKSGETLVIQEITLDPGALIPRHYHLERSERYWWVSGKGVLIMSDQEHEFFETGARSAFIRKGGSCTACATIRPSRSRSRRCTMP